MKKKRYQKGLTLKIFCLQDVKRLGFFKPNTLPKDLEEELDDLSNEPPMKKLTVIHYNKWSQKGANIQLTILGMIPGVFKFYSERSWHFQLP
jgi:hypothetical protein